MTYEETFAVPDDPQYEQAADCILDGVEEAFDLVHEGSRDRTRRAVINILKHFTIPRRAGMESRGAK